MNIQKVDQKTTSQVQTLMHAIRLRAGQSPAGLVYETVETPRPAAGEVLVRVHAAAITRDELTWPGDRLPAIPSYEFSGVVAALGPGVQDFSVGEAVYAYGDYHRDGAAAEYTLIQSAFLARKPRSLGHIESAAIPLAALSSWQGLLLHGGLEPGQRVLIHGAAGGVGLFAVQLAHQRGAVVIGSAPAASRETVLSQGADEVIDPTAPFEKALSPVDLVFDTAGGERLERSPAVLRPGGRLVSVAGQPPDSAFARGIQAVYFVVEPNRQQLSELAALADQGLLRPVIEAVYPLAEACRAFEHSLRRHGPGKIVLQISE